jgi:hypothetical protein
LFIYSGRNSIIHHPEKSGFPRFIHIKSYGEELYHPCWAKAINEHNSKTKGNNLFIKDSLMKRVPGQIKFFHPAKVVKLFFGKFLLSLNMNDIIIV